MLGLLLEAVHSVEYPFSAQPWAARNGVRQQPALGKKLEKCKCKSRNGCSRKRTERGNSEVFKRTHGHYGEERSEGLYANDNKDYSNTKNREMSLA